MGLRILQPTDWSFEPVDTYNKNGGDVFSVSRFGYELFPDYGVEVDYCVPDYAKLVARILKRILKLEGCNLLLQIELIKRSKDYDLIYYSADRHPYLLALARKLRICRKPILMICHFSYDTRAVDSKMKKLILKLERKLVFSSIDQILFNCDNLMKLAMEDGNLPKKHQINSGWGADLSYFSRGKYGVHKDKMPYYFAAGGANRDYHTIIEAFKQLPYTLIISCPKRVIDEEGPLPSNIIYFNYEDYGIMASERLREYYHDAKAILIPVMHRNHVANGASVLVESLACGKPILISNLDTNFLDVEKERIGYKINLHDIQGWVDAIRKLEELSDSEFNTMGLRAKKIAETRYNYRLFTEKVVDHMNLLIKGEQGENEI